jgi:hypothetical protein
MTEVGVYQAGFLKHGAPIGNASFVQVLWDPQKHEYTVPLSSPPSNQGDGLYDGIWLAVGASGTVQVSAPNFKSNRFTMSNGDGYHEVWLST